MKVTDQFFIERYSHVMHIVSNVEGKLSSRHDAVDALAPRFPASTVSGGPKDALAMEIIDNWEGEAPGALPRFRSLFLAVPGRLMDTSHRAAHALVKDGVM